MNKFLLFFLLTGFMNVFAASPVIKSLRWFTEGDEKSIAVLIFDNNKQDRIVIDFDVQADQLPDISIVFKFCDKNWKPVSNIFLLNQGQNLAYNLDYNTLPTTVHGARYHFRNSYPDNRGLVSFPFSGKWMFFITDSQDSSIVYGTGRFYVVIPENEQVLSIKPELLEDKTYYPLELGRIFKITSKFDLKEELFPGNIIGMEVIENQKLFYPFFIDKTFNSNVRQFYWDGNRSFSFTIRDIKPGNEYRQTDFRNTSRFIGPDIKAQIDGIEYSRFDKFGKRDNDGAKELTPFTNDYADYLNVNFSFRPAESSVGDVFLTGSFNNWQLLGEYLMTNSDGLYTKTLELKRGVYDYQYVTADIINNKMKNENWILMEGNFWETSNVYHVFIYYNDPNYGGYDKIISYQRIRSK